MRMMLLVCLLAVGVFGQGPESWQDPSKHEVQFVEVEEGVRLEVLDWGGTGRPIVLLAGYNTAQGVEPFLSLYGPCSADGPGSSRISRNPMGFSAQPGYSQLALA